MDDIRDEFKESEELTKMGGRKRGVKTMLWNQKVRQRAYLNSRIGREHEADRRRNAPITLPKFKCLEGDQ
jgi:hypothetical protein